MNKKLLKTVYCSAFAAAELILWVLVVTIDGADAVNALCYCFTCLFVFAVMVKEGSKQRRHIRCVIFYRLRRLLSGNRPYRTVRIGARVFFRRPDFLLCLAVY